jgi:hypothetical protein
MFDENHHEAMRAASWKEVDELEWLTHCHKETMVTAVFNGAKENVLNTSV